MQILDVVKKLGLAARMMLGSDSAYEKLREKHVQEMMELMERPHQVPKMRASAISLLDKHNKFMLPYLIAGIEGDLDARKEYEESRAIVVEILPHWGQKLILELANKQMEGARLGSFFSGSRSERRKTYFKLKPGRENFFELEELYKIGFHLLATYTEGKLILDRIEKYAPEISKSEIKKCHLSDLDGNPMGDSPLSFLSREILKKSLALMLSIVIVEDFLRSQGLALSDEALEALALEVNGRPWDLVEHNGLKRVLVAKDLLKSSSFKIPQDEKVEFLSQCIISGSGLTKLRSYLDRLSKDQTMSIVPVVETEPRIAESEKRDGLRGESYRDEFKACVVAALDEAGCQLKVGEKGLIARKLYALERKGFLAFDKFVKGLSDKKDPYELIESIYLEERSLRRIKEATNHEEMGERDKASSPEESSRISVASGECRILKINPALSKHFQEWFDRLSPDIREIIMARAFRISCGNFGDTKLVKSKPKGVHELRFDINGGLRLYYFKRDGGQDIVFLCGGDKNTQNDDIVLAGSLLEKCSIYDFEDFFGK